MFVITKLLLFFRTFVLLNVLRLLMLFRPLLPQAKMSPTTPVHRIPHELISKIFTFVSSDPSFDPVHLINITHVCVRWREIAFASGNIWSRIALTYPITPGHFSYASTMLKRSGAYPINIFLDLRDPAWDWDEDTHRFGWKEMEPLMRLFLVHIARWKTIELLTDTWAPIFTFLWYTTQRAEAAPILERISLSRCNAYFAATGQTFQPISLGQPIQFFGGAKLEKLRHVSLVGVHVDWGATSSLRNLSRLELKYLAADVMPKLTQFESLIAGCPFLLELSLYACGPRLEDSGLSEKKQIYLAQVQKLSIGFSDTTYTIRVLSLLVVPKLESMVLEDVSKAVNPYSDPQNVTELLEWFTTSDNLPLQRIKFLELHGVLASQDLLNSFSRHFKSVSSLSLFEMENSMLSALMPPLENTASMNGDNIAFPALSQLFCQDIDAEHLVEMVASRARSRYVLPLQEVFIEFVRTSPSHSSRIYDRLKNSGIRIIVADKNDNDGSMDS